MKYGCVNFNWCPELIVRTDFGYNSPKDYKTISMCECKRLQQGKKCKQNGKCIIARDSETGNNITKKTKIREGEF